MIIMGMSHPWKERTSHYYEKKTFQYIYWIGRIGGSKVKSDIERLAEVLPKTRGKLHTQIANNMVWNPVGIFHVQKWEPRQKQYGGQEIK